MKLNPIPSLILTGALFALTANAQEQLTITGSTAFRSITIDRTASLFDAYASVTNSVSTGLITYRGTMSNAVPSLGNTPVTLRLSFSGSATGMKAVNDSALITTAEAPGSNVNQIADIALSDVWPEAATPALDSANFDQDILGVIPFVFVRNNALTGVTNITREQAVLLQTASGIVTNGTNVIYGMPATFLGGSSTNPVFNVGRDAGSGTRITVLKCIGLTGTPVNWQTNGTGGYILTTNNGFSSGGVERGVIAAKPDAIGYLGEADSLNIAGSATVLSYQGIPFSHMNVAVGMYPIWGYEHIVNRAGGLNANQQAVRNALIAAITNPDYQSTNTLYTASFVSLSDMKVERGADGGAITSKNF